MGRFDPGPFLIIHNFTPVLTKTSGPLKLATRNMSTNTINPGRGAPWLSHFTKRAGSTPLPHGCKGITCGSNNHGGKTYLAVGVFKQGNTAFVSLCFIHR